ncbi:MULTISPECIES: T9SS type A sorting domain-containing protein [Bizionia]|uniref:T9SS type A sorting domain-containing protein n=1 Tax=Bizionia algoritergicola TaxID=291187 RepID=A0A5D0QVM0_9FLAO|nr:MULTISPECIES: T9SS type A sorting domain-containing protein [Bizionia]OBX22180.1 hypothetical protein BAA08_09560 [Bizionia sp. APA-3]TYB73247.1 T9SS type A sorting domain-containing protein [Bizionia algoritergicola]
MKKTILIACLFFATQLMYSQKAIPASGGNATGSGGSFSYTVGQLVYTTNTGSGTLTQGVQQSIELFTLSNLELSTVNLTAVTYPNPTSDYVVLAISDAKLTDLSYALFDLQGRVVVKGSVSQERSKISMENLASGTYILKVSQNNQALKTFKIIKK